MELFPPITINNAKQFVHYINTESARWLPNDIIWLYIFFLSLSLNETTGIVMYRIEIDNKTLLYQVSKMKSKYGRDLQTT